MSASGSIPRASIAGLAEQREKLATAATDVEHGAASRKSSTYGRCRSRMISVEPRMRLSKAK